MTLFVDADSCPVRIREIVCKTAQRLRVSAVFVANRIIPIPKNDYCRSVVTAAENQAADSFIVSNAVSGDIVITRDIPLCWLTRRYRLSTIEVPYTQRKTFGNGFRLEILCMNCKQTGLFPNALRRSGKKKLWILPGRLTMRHSGF